VKILSQDPFVSSEAVPNLGLPWALAVAQLHFAGHDDVVGAGGGWCGLDRLGPVPEGWSSPIQR
jgi:hypothetical protein